MQRLEVSRGTAGYERVEPGGHHHHHAICRRLRAHGPLRGPRAWSGRSAELSERVSFEVTDHDVVLRGRLRALRGLSPAGGET